MSEVIDPLVEFWALPYREKGQRKLLYSFDGPVSPRYGAYILKSAYDQLQAQASQLLKECDVWYDNSKIMAEAYVELKEKLQAAEAERDKLLCGDLYKHWEKQNIELQAQLAAAEAEIERLRHGHYKDDHRFHPLKAENDNLRAEIERLNINLTEQAKDHADDWKRIQDAERKLEEALARGRFSRGTHGPNGLKA